MADEHHESVEATIDSGIHCRGTELTSNNTSDNAERWPASYYYEYEKSLEHAEELMERGSKDEMDGDYAKATDCYSRALENRVAHFGELSPLCAEAYYKFGCNLLYKAQEVAEPLAAMPKKAGVSKDDSNIDGPEKCTVNAVPSVASIANSAEHGGSSNRLDEAHEDPDKAVEEDDEEEDEVEDEDESDAEDLPDHDEAESDLDLAWSVLDIARVIVEKHSGDTIEKAEILLALAEEALERDDVEISLSEFLKSLSILEHLVEPDSQTIVELNFRICFCLEIVYKHEEAIPYCQKAISVCKSRLQRLMNEVKNSSEPAETTSSESTQTSRPSCVTSQSDDLLADNKAEIETLTGLCANLEKNLEDLQQFISNPTFILGMTSAKAGAIEKIADSVAMDSSQTGTATSGRNSESPTASTARMCGASKVTHLGVVGRGVKRLLINSKMPDSRATFNQLVSRQG